MNSLYRRWRPQTFAVLLGQDAIRDTLFYALTHDRVSHAYLFCGPRGTGKTTTARLVAKLVNCTGLAAKPCNACVSCLSITEGSNLDVIELDAASNRGIDEIRQLRETVKFAPVTVAYKVFIIDEVHMLTREAFNALLKTLEEPPARVIFILATTEPHKVPATIISRCQRFDFRLADETVLADHLTQVAKAEKMKLSPSGAQFLARLAQGSFRDGLSILDQLKSRDLAAYDQPTIEAALGFIASEKLLALTGAVFGGDGPAALKLLDGLLAAGADVRAVGDQLLFLARELLETAAIGEHHSSGLAPTVERVIAWIDLLADALVASKACPIPRLPLELAIAKYARSDQKSPTIVKPPLAAEAGDPNTHASLPASPPPSIPADTASLAVPVIAEIPEHISSADWAKILAAVKDESPSLLASLGRVRVLTVEDDTVTLAVPYKMHAEKLNQVKNRATVEAALANVLGVPLRLQAQVNKEAIDDDLVDVAEVFELEM